MKWDSWEGTGASHKSLRQWLQPIRLVWRAQHDFGLDY